MIAIQSARGGASENAVRETRSAYAAAAPPLAVAAISPPVRHHHPEGDDADKAIGHARSTCKGGLAARRKLVKSRTYEITFLGRAGAVLRAEFDDCDISVGPGTTTLRAELPDQGALQGLLQRIAGLRLELVDLHLVASRPG
jgi:hypothetical protein